jgi:hypothetical protein
MPLNIVESGLGDPLAQFKVYIANRPDFSEYPSLETIKPLSVGEIQEIGRSCGNGWRKVFNVYAKLVFALNTEPLVSLHQAQSWQDFREHTLLQRSSNTSLLFSCPQITPVENNKTVHIIMGKTYANSLKLPHSLRWLDHEFAVDPENGLFICPYFDYRQLSNIKIIRLVELIKQLKKSQTYSHSHTQ